MMVEQMVNSKFSKHGLGEHATTSPSFNKQPIVVPKTTALRDVQNDNRNSIAKPSGNFASQNEAQPSVAPARSVPGSIFCPPRLLSGGSTTRNQQFVYARRKSDAELINGRTSDKNHRVTPGPHANIDEPNHDGIPIPIISNATLSCDEKLQPKPIRKHDHGQPTVVKSDPSFDDSRVTGNPHWRDRFIQLQTYLKYCDNSNQESYLKKIRLLTSKECSRHASELERRAIHLMLEEGREIQRMREMNVLGKPSANHCLSPLTPIFKSEK